MKYEVPVCEMIKFCTEDVITTSYPTVEEIPGYGDTVVNPLDNDNGASGVAN